MAKLAETGRKSSWPVRANSLLLVLQTTGLGGISAYSIYQIDWQQVQQQAETDGTLSPELTTAIEHTAVTVFTLGPPAVLALLAALGFLFLFRIGWLLAMTVQVLTLLACLLLYSDWRPVSDWDPVFIYPVMLYCIVMVLYLNSSDVRAAFHVRLRTGARGTTREP